MRTERHGHFTPVCRIQRASVMMRWLLVEAAQTAVRFDPELQRVYRRLKFNKGASVAKVAIARKLAVKLYWLLRATASCAQMAPMQGRSGGTLVPNLGSSF
jgi:transposase